MSSNSWYYVENDTQIGPVDDGQIRQLIGQGAITSNTPVWQDGMADWDPARDHFDFDAAAGAPPDVPTHDHYREDTLGADGLYVGAPSRGFTQAISVCFKKYFGFGGRASRSEFWYWVLFTFLAGMVIGIFDSAVFGSPSGSGPLGLVFSLATFFPGLAVAFRRLHDINRSGWWIGVFFVAPFAWLLATFGIAGVSMDAQFTVLPSFLALVAATVIYAVVLLVFFCKRGDLSRNRYG